jgi:putative transport protein
VIGELLGALVEALRSAPELALFLLLGTGYLIGNARLFGFQFGSTAGVLVVGLVMGHLGIKIPLNTQSIGFIFFIYCVGLEAGPQFFSAFREDGGRFLLLAHFVAAVAVVTTLWLTQLLDFGAGYSAGVLAGALTSTPTLMVAKDAINAGMADLAPGVSQAVAAGNLTVSYAITYLYGLVGVVILVGLVPRILRIHLPSEAAKLARLRDPGRAADPDRDRWQRAGLPILRVYRVERDDPVGREIEQEEFLERTGCVLGRLKRDGVVHDATPRFTLEPGDLVAVGGARSEQSRAREFLGPEVGDAELLEVRPETRSVVITRREAVGRTAAELGIVEVQDLFLSEISRAGMDIPPSPDLKLHKGDVLIVTGNELRLNELIHKLGRAERPIHETDLVTFAFGSAAGIAAGLFSIRIGNASVGLGLAGGLLLAGLLIGLLRIQVPNLGRVPRAVRWVFMELGLLFFTAGIGVGAGGGIVAAFSDAGAVLLVAGMAVTTLSVLLGFAFGHYVLRLHPVILLGALTGATTSSSALGIVKKKTGSSLPAVGYAGTYTFANVILALVGGLLIRF